MTANDKMKQLEKQIAARIMADLVPSVAKRATDILQNMFTTNKKDKK